MGTVELHGAFRWDCDECGREVFERAVEGDVAEAVMVATEDHVVHDLVAIDAQEGDNPDELEAQILVSTIRVCPKYVKCPHCGTSFETSVRMIDDEEGDDDLIDSA